MTRTFTRSSVAVAALAVGALTLAACGSSSSDSGSTAGAGGSAPGSSAPAAANSAGASSAGISSGGGSSAPAASGPPVTITFMEAMSSGAQKASLAKMTADFHQANPNITVQLQPQPDYGTLFTKITAATAAGNPPTIAQVYESWADTLASSQVIVPLDDYAKSSDQVKDFYDGIQKDMKLPDGKTWMWPFNKSVVVMYYNTSMVKTAPTTWDQFATDAKSASTGKVVALNMDPGSTSGPAGGTAMFEILAQSFGDQVFAADGTPQFTKPGVVKAMDYLVQMKKDNSLALGTNYPGQTTLGNATGAFDISSVASYPYNLSAVGGKFKMGVAGLPAGPSGTANQLAGTNISLFAKASDDQKAAAWKYLQFLTSTPEMAYWASTSGYLPISKSATADPTFKAYEAKNPWVTPAIKQLNIATALPPKSWVEQASGALAQAIQAAVSGNSSSADALAKAQDAAMSDMKNAG